MPNGKIRFVFAVAVLWQLVGLIRFNSRFGRYAVIELAEDGTITRTQNKTLKGATIENQNLVLSRRSSWKERHGWKSLIENTTARVEPQTGGKLEPRFPSDAIIRRECFGYNSEEWINGRILSNIHDGITPELLDTLIEGPRDLSKVLSIFEETICHPKSPLRSPSPIFLSNTTKEYDRLGAVEEWYHRLLHLAIHWKFHSPAFQEHQARKRCADSIGKTNFEIFMDKQTIGPMDFECPDVKFIVIPMGSIGFGAFLNTQASLSILLALKTNRIPVFSSKSFFPWQKRKGPSDPWLLAPPDCSRRDMQCYFLPTSPCTITTEELDKAPIFGSTKHEQRFLGVNLSIPEEMKNERVVVFNSGLEQKTHDSIEMRKIASDVISSLLEEWRNGPTDQRLASTTVDWNAIEMAHRWIMEKSTTDIFGLLRQVYIYMLRPNPYYQNMLKDHLSAILPATLDPSHTIGIAVRGSDKCKSESMCLPFERYMELATEVALPSIPISKGRPNLILTTEDPNVFNDSLPYQQNSSFPFQFLVNKNDNMQGSGYPKDFSSSGVEESTIVSSLVALQFHFHAGKVYLNCCSNFHLVLKYLLEGQCGAKRHGHSFVFGTEMASSVAECLSHENVPRRFGICCGWSKRKGVCGEMWKEYLMEKERKNLIHTNDHGNIEIGIQSTPRHHNNVSNFP